MTVEQNELANLTCLVNQSPDIGLPDLGFHHPPDQYLPNPLVVRRPDIKVFPNPSNALIQFEIQLPFSNTEDFPTVSIYNLLGQKMEDLPSPPDNKLNDFRLYWLPGENVSSGVYFAVIKNARSVYNKKLVIIR